jgi:predicted restriction endonuclease
MDTIKLVCDNFSKSKNINKLLDEIGNNRLLIEFYLEYVYDININDYLKEINIKRINQSKFREQLIKRWNSKCIIDPEDNDNIYICEACHIVPISEINDYNIDNGLFLGKNFHTFFDRYELSINPETLTIELCGEALRANRIKKFNNVKLEQLQNFPRIQYYLRKHYEKFIKMKKIMIDI